MTAQLTDDELYRLAEEATRAAQQAQDLVARLDESFRISLSGSRRSCSKRSKSRESRDLGGRSANVVTAAAATAAARDAARKAGAAVDAEAEAAIAVAEAAVLLLRTVRTAHHVFLQRDSTSEQKLMEVGDNLQKVHDVIAFTGQTLDWALGAIRAIEGNEDVAQAARDLGDDVVRTLLVEAAFEALDTGAWKTQTLLLAAMLALVYPPGELSRQEAAEAALQTAQAVERAIAAAQAGATAAQDAARRLPHLLALLPPSAAVASKTRMVAQLAQAKRRSNLVRSTRAPLGTRCSLHVRDHLNKLKRPCRRCPRLRLLMRPQRRRRQLA